MMKKNGLEHDRKYRLNISKWRQNILCSFVLEGKGLDYYHKTRRGLGYVSTRSISEVESEKIAQTGVDNDTPNWDSSGNTSAIF